jgi:hypothetical protein
MLSIYVVNLGTVYWKEQRCTPCFLGRFHPREQEPIPSRFVYIIIIQHESTEGKLTFINVGSKFKTQLGKLMDNLKSTVSSETSFILVTYTCPSNYKYSYYCGTNHQEQSWFWLITSRFGVFLVIQTKYNKQTLQDFYLYIQNKTINKDTHYSLFSL